MTFHQKIHPSENIEAWNAIPRMLKSYAKKCWVDWYAAIVANIHVLHILNREVFNILHISIRYVESNEISGGWNVGLICLATMTHHREADFFLLLLPVKRSPRFRLKRLFERPWASFNNPTSPENKRKRSTIRCFLIILTLFCGLGPTSRSYWNGRKKKMLFRWKDLFPLRLLP